MLVTILSILTLLALLIGATFCYFSMSATSTPQVITTSNLNFIVGISGNATNINNISPTTWSDNILNDINGNKNIAKIPFTVSSTSDVKYDWDVKISSLVQTNSNLSGGNISDIKYKVYENKTFIKGGDISTNEVIVSGTNSSTQNLSKSYDLYVYIEETDNEQNSLQGISFNVNLVGNADQIE